MSGRRILALTVRIIRQFRRDPRTLALLFVVPIAILSLLGYIYRGSEESIHLGLTGDLENPVARSIIEQIERDGQIQTVAVDYRSRHTVLEMGEVDGVLTLPEAPTFGLTSPSPLALYFEGSDPNRAGRITAAIRQALPTAMLHNILETEPRPLLSDVQFIHGGPEFDQLDFLAPVFIGFFGFFFVFLLTSVSFLRERMQGSIERLMVSPISRLEIVTGYMIGFLLFAALQSAIIIGFSILALDIHQVGNTGYIFLITLLLTLGAVNLGIFLSTFARTELQVVQFIPVVIVPQALLSGMIWSIEAMPGPLQWFARALPLTWANEALRAVMIRGTDLDAIWMELTALAGFAILMVLLSSLTLRRDVA